MERAVTYSDHSTTVTTCYFTQAPHKSFGPMTQLLPGPQCPNVTHVLTVLLQTCPSPCTPPSLRPPHPRCSRLPFMHSLSVPFNVHSLLYFSVSYFSHPHSSVCLPVSLSLLSCRALTLYFTVSLSPPCLASPALSLCNIRLDWHPVSESLQVLSASCRVRMDI